MIESRSEAVPSSRQAPYGHPALERIDRSRAIASRAQRHSAPTSNRWKSARSGGREQMWDHLPSQRARVLTISSVLWALPVPSPKLAVTRCTAPVMPIGFRTP